MSRLEPSETAITASAALERHPLAEARQRVAAAQLLGLPRAQRLQRVHGRDVRDPVDQLGQMTPELGVPGVAVRELGALDVGGHDQVDRHRLQRGEMRLVARQRVPRPVGVHRRVLAVRAPAVHGEVHARGELAREVLDVDARAAVDLGRVLAREQRDAHAQVWAPPPRPERPWGRRRRRRLTR